MEPSLGPTYFDRDSRQTQNFHSRLMARYGLGSFPGLRGKTADRGLSCQTALRLCED